MYISAAAPADFIIEGENIPSGEAVPFVEEGFFSAIETTIAKTPAHISCAQSRSTSNSNLEGGGTSTGEVELNGCTVYTINKGIPENQPKCKISPFKVSFTGELIELGVDKRVGTKEKETFGEMSVTEVSGTGSCALAGTYALTGYQLCAFPSAEIEEPVHPVVCDPSGSKLQMAAQEAKLIPCWPKWFCDAAGAAGDAAVESLIGSVRDQWSEIRADIKYSPKKINFGKKAGKILVVLENPGELEIKSIAIEKFPSEYKLVPPNPCVGTKVKECKFEIELTNGNAAEDYVVADIKTRDTGAHYLWRAKLQNK
jgi:hypothetical protein